MQWRSVFVRTLGERRRSVLFWAVGLALLSLMYASIYPSIAASADIQQLFASMPTAVQSIVGTVSLYATPEGYINGELFSLVLPLLLGILGIFVGANVLNKEEETGTIELLLARPITRASLLRQKALGVAVLLVVPALAVWLMLAAATQFVDKFDLNLGNAAAATTMAWLVSVVFASLALLLTAVQRSRGFSLGVTTTFFALSYVLHVFADSVSWVHHMRAISIFEYYRSDEVIFYGLHWSHVLILAVLAIVFYAIAEIVFRIRDLRV